MRKVNILSRLLLLVLAVCALSVAAFAQGPIDIDKPSELTVDYHFIDATPIVGAKFSIYRFASVDPYENYTLTPSFAPYASTLDPNASWGDIYSALKLIVTGNDAITPDYVRTTDENGKIVIDDAATGAYYIISDKCVMGDYTYISIPAVTMLPVPDDDANDWIYSVTVVPKVDRSPVVPPEDPEDPPTVIRKAVKVWEDSGHVSRRPENITVRLYCDGALYDTRTLNAACDWRYTWTDLPEYDSYGALIIWSLTEDEIEGYERDVTQNGVTFIVTNKERNGLPPIDPPVDPPVDPPEEPILPQTGLLWWPVPILVCAGILLLAVGIVKRRSDER